MKLTEVIAIWDKLRVGNDIGNLVWIDFEKAVEAVVDIENDAPGCQPSFNSETKLQ